MNTKNPVNKIGASLLITVALITLTYLLLPNGRSVGAAPQLQPGTTNKALASSVRADQKRMRMALGQLPLSFEMNRGQFDPQVRFASRGASYKAFFTQSEMVFVLRNPAATQLANANPPTASKATKAEQLAQAQKDREERAASKAVVRMSLAGANPEAQVTGVSELPGKINYFRGNEEQKWITDVP